MNWKLIESDTYHSSYRDIQLGDDCSECAIHILKSGFDNLYIVVFESCYGDLSSEHLDAKKIEEKYGIKV